MIKKNLSLVITTFILTFLLHFGYTILPNNITAIFFPVNESVWEHMKILYGAFIVVQLIEYLILKRKKQLPNNFIITSFLSAFLAIVLYLILYLPLDYLMGHSLILAISLILVVIIIIYLHIRPAIKKYFINKNNYKALGFLLIIFSYIVFGYLTFYPPKIPLFYDTSTNSYGISNPN